MGEGTTVGSCSIRLPPVYLRLNDDDSPSPECFQGLKAPTTMTDKVQLASEVGTTTWYP